MAAGLPGRRGGDDRSDTQGVSTDTAIAPICLAPPQPGDFCCIPVPGGFGTAIETGQYLAEKLQGQPAHLRAYDHAEVYIGQPDRSGPGMHGYTYSAYPDNGTNGKTGRRPLPCPPEQLPGSIWSSGIIELAPVRRTGIVLWCEAHPSVPYSWPDYGAIALHALGLKTDRLRAYIVSTSSMICSQYTDAALNHGGGVHLFDGRWEGFVTPGDLAGLLLGRINSVPRAS
jgi:hypothetical protein